MTSQITQRDKENKVPGPIASPKQIQTPTKPPPSVSAFLENLGQKHPWGVEVKNTFIHYGSPVKTITVATPPKTVPCNFAPEVLLREQAARTPLPVQAQTPSTAGAGGSTGPAHFYDMSQVAQVPTHGKASSGALLRLSDFLPSPVVGAQPVVASTVMPGRGAYDAFMPPVPPLPGPPFGSTSVPSSVPPPPAQPPAISLSLSGQALHGGLLPPQPIGFDPSRLPSLPGGPHPTYAAPIVVPPPPRSEPSLPSWPPQMTEKVSISVSHFPEPSSCAVPVPIPQAHQWAPYASYMQPPAHQA